MDNFNTYQSPFSWRYASPQMREIWSEVYKRKLWRKIWVALANVQSTYDLVTPDQVEDLKSHQDQINIQRALEIEEEIRHDLMAEIKTYSEQCPIGGGIIHLGATSMDIEDNADAIRVKDAMGLVLERLKTVLSKFCELIDYWAGTPIMAFTHLQPAEPSTLGYRLSLYAQDLFEDYSLLQETRNNIRGKGFKGAVGSAASYEELIGAENYPGFERRLSEELNLPFYMIASQTYPRKQDYTVTAALAGLAITISKFAFDLRILQSPPIGEWREPFGKKQVGSSAMPFKRNPIQAEKLNSLARLAAQFPQIAWQNAAQNLLERTLDDSANRRTILPESFLLADELLITLYRILNGLTIDQEAISRNLSIFGPFASTEKVLMALGKAGADRQQMHEVLRNHSLASWEEVRLGKPNTLIDRILHDPFILQYLRQEDIINLMRVEEYIGHSESKSKQMAQKIRLIIG